VGYPVCNLYGTSIEKYMTHVKWTFVDNTTFETRSVSKIKIIKNTINLNWFRQNNRFMLEEQFDIL